MNRPSPERHALRFAFGPIGLHLFDSRTGQRLQ